MIRSRCFIVAFVVATCALIPASAFAGQTTVSYSGPNTGNKLIVSTDSDDRNDISITQQGDTYTFTEAGVSGLNNNPITLNETEPTVCTKPAAAVVCTVTGLALIDVRLFRGDDLLDAQDLGSADPHPVSTSMTVNTTDNSGDDNDDFATGEGPDTVDAGMGDDFVAGNGGNDNLNGGAGDDSVDGGIGNDALDGGENTGNDTSDEIDSLIGDLGNDTLTGGPGDDDLVGDEGDDTYVADSVPDGADLITEYDGNDTADYSARTTTVELSNDDDPNDGTTASGREDGGGPVDGFLDDVPSDVETLIGGTAADRLTGVGTNDPAVPNVLRGNGAADALDGSTPGASPNTADYSTASSGVTVNLATGTVSGVAGADILTDIDNAYGSPAGDTLTGSGTDNLLRGNTGNDTLTGGGGSGDIVDYSNASAAVTVNLSTNAASGAAGTDTLATIENAYGSPSGDTLTGNAQPNLLRGNAGLDVLTGGGGSDTADYSTAPGSVIVNLVTAAASGAAGNDTLAAIADVVGGESNDSLTGDGNANALTGRGGSDTLIGGKGADSFDGGDGNDNIQSVETPALSDSPIICGLGADTVSADADPNDPTGGDCENVTRGAGPPPAAPTLTATTPASPANDNAPKIKGAAAAGTTVRLYSSSNCTGSPVSGSAANFASPGLTVAVGDNSTTDFYATATDGASQTSGCSTSPITYVEDSTAPDTTIDSGPPVSTNDPTPTLDFNSSDAGSTFECSLDGALFAACTPPLTTGTLPDGPHTFDVRAKDAAGNLDASPATRSFTVDTAAPDTSITSGPAEGSSSSNDAPSFSFESPDSSASFQCKVDGGPFEDCTSPSTTAALGDGQHSFQVRATDIAGNADPTPATRSFTVKHEVPPGGGGSGGGGGPPVTDSTAPKMALASKSAKVSKKGAVKLRISCPTSEQGGCAGSVSLGKIQSGSASFGRVGAGKDTTVTIRLSSKARKTLKKKKKLVVTAKITARDDSGNSTTSSAKLTIKE
jgi:Ca2+-binding RTX toxin-like protein